MYITIKSPKKGGGKRIKKAICREIIKTKTRATYTRANARARRGKGALRREEKGREGGREGERKRTEQRAIEEREGEER